MEGWIFRGLRVGLLMLLAAGPCPCPISLSSLRPLIRLRQPQPHQEGLLLRTRCTNRLATAQSSGILGEDSKGAAGGVKERLGIAYC